MNVKFVDDLSIAVRVNLESDLVIDSGRPKPLNYEERFETNIKVTSNLLQEMIDDLKIFSSERNMLINEKKSSVMKFTKSRTKDFPTEIKMHDKFLQVKNKIKVFGVILTSDLRWEANTDYICTKAYKNIWMIRRMKSLKMEPLVILEYYLKEIRVHLELAVPVWHSGLTVKLSDDIERVQRVAIAAITGLTEFDYEDTCALLGLKPLYLRRQELCERFAKKTASEKCRHNDLFQIQNSAYNTRSKNFKEHFCHTTRFYKSALPSLTRILNKI